MNARKGTCWIFALATLGLLMIWDREAFQLMHRVGSDLGVGQALAWLTFLGAGHYQASFALLLLASGYLLRVERLKQAGGFSAYAIGLSALASNCLKILIGRARPSLGLSHWAFIGPTFLPRYNSFPSGHATVVFAFAATLAHLWPRARCLFLLGAGVIALSRVFTGSHFPSDVFGGALLGIFVSGVVERQLSREVIRASRPGAWILARYNGLLEAMRKGAHWLLQRPVVGWCLILMILLSLNRGRNYPFDSEEVIVDMVGAAIVVVGWGLRVWIKGGFLDRVVGMDLTGVGSLAMSFGFGVMLQSWWAFIVLCGAAAFAEAFAEAPRHQADEPRRRETGSLGLLWEEAKLLKLCLLAMAIIEVSEYLYRMYAFR